MGAQAEGTPGTACSRAAGWRVLFAGLPRLWAQLGARPPSPPTPTLLALQGLERAEEGSSSWGPSGQARSLRVNPAGHQDLGVSHCYLSFSFSLQIAVLRPLRGACNLVVGKGWFPGGPGMFGRCPVGSEDSCWAWDSRSWVSDSASCEGAERVGGSWCRGDVGF